MPYLDDGPVLAGYSIYRFDPDAPRPDVAYSREDPEREALLLGD